jgi:hypothetical protein
MVKLAIEYNVDLSTIGSLMWHRLCRALPANGWIETREVQTAVVFGSADHQGAMPHQFHWDGLSD